jgi:hypothetical protein
MNAKEAYDLAATKSDISSILADIKIAAEKGHTDLIVPELNEFQISALQQLRYWVLRENAEAYRIGPPLKWQYRISWKNGGRTEIDEKTAALSAAMERFNT